MFEKYKPSRAPRSMDSDQLVKPRVQTKFGEEAFSYYAACNWNKLPEDLRGAPQKNKIKTRLKLIVFSGAYA